MTLGWHRAIAYALVGEEVGVGVQDVPDVPVLLAELAAHGWPAERVRAHAQAAHEREPWPHPIPDAVRAGLGAAQLYAAVGRAREALGLSVFEVRPPSARTSLDADERRLVADRPPHFGRT